MSESSLTIITFLGVLLVALAGGRFLLRTRYGQRPAFMRFTMALYLGLGLTVGSAGLGLLSAELLHNLEPVRELTLGWIGLLFGLQLGYRPLSRFPSTFHRIMLFESVFTMVLVAGAIWLILDGLDPSGGIGGGEAILALAALGAVSSPTSTALAALGGGRAHHRLARLAHFVSSLDPLLPLVGFALLVGYSHPAGGGWVSSFQWLAASLLLGLALGLLFYSYARHRHEERELTMLIIAFTVFAGGAASYLHLSSLFISVVLGATLANLLPARERVFRTLSTREKPILILLLVLTGANWHPGEAAELSEVWVLLAVYLIARTAGKLGAIALVWPSGWDDKERQGRLGGLALLGQGGMSLALIANYQILFAGRPGVTAVVTVGLLALVVGELYSARAARKALYSDSGGRAEQ